MKRASARSVLIRSGRRVSRRRRSKTAPREYTSHHLAERILSSRAAPEGERKQVTVFFADVKGPTSEPALFLKRNP